MCGIIYAKNLVGSEPVNNLIKILYQNQKDRGVEGFGFVGMNAEKIDTYRATNEAGIVGFLNDKLYSEIMFHHRNPTSTENTLKSTHPFVVKLDSKSYYFVHNGIVQNADELQKEHRKRDIAYKSQAGELFNDSEALAWDFCLWLNNKQAQMRAKGAVAFICLETDKGNRAVKLYFYHNEAVPLKVYRDKTLLVISSEGGYPSLKENCLYCWDYGGRQILKKRCLRIVCQSDWEYYPGEYYPYDEYPGYEVDLRDELRALEQERDCLISAGRYDDADYIQEQITDLAYQLKGRI